MSFIGVFDAKTINNKSEGDIMGVMCEWAWSDCRCSCIVALSVWMQGACCQCQLLHTWLQGLIEQSSDGFQLQSQMQSLHWFLHHGLVDLHRL